MSSFSTLTQISIVGQDASVDNRPFLNQLFGISTTSSPDIAGAQRLVSPAAAATVNLPTAPAGAAYLFLQASTDPAGTTVGIGAVNLRLGGSPASIALQVPQGGGLLLPLASAIPPGGGAAGSAPFTFTNTSLVSGTLLTVVYF